MNILSKTRFAHESNALSNAVGEYLLDNYEVVENYNKRVIESRDYLKKALASMGIGSHGSYGNYLLLNMGDRDRSASFVKYLRERFIYTKGPWSEPWDNHITITIGPIETMRRFLDATENFLNK